MADIPSKSELRSTWEKAAPGWAKWEAVLSQGLHAPTETLLDMASVGPGMRVLDVACGAGTQSIQLARRVGPDGRVVASDISPTMLDFLRRSAASEGLQNLETVECAADELGDLGPPFDAAISRLGLMLFPSPISALHAVQRVMKPSARFAALVFTTPANNPFMAKPLAILLRHADKSPPGPGQPGIFALGGAGVLQDLMKQSGLGDVQTRTVRASLRLASAVEALTMMQEAFGVYRALVADLDEARRAEAWAEVQDCLKQFETDGGFMAEFEWLIGSGATPA